MIGADFRNLRCQAKGEWGWGIRWLRWNYLLVITVIFTVLHL